MFGRWFDGPSWDVWRAVARAAFGASMSRREIELFRGLAGRDPPRGRVKELWVISGRRSGKDSIASAIAAHVAASFDPAGLLRPGERAVVLLLAVDKSQADVVHGYIRAFFELVPSLAKLVRHETSDGFELSNGVDVVIAANDYRRVRGRSVLCAILDEVSYWRDEHSANPDREVYRSIRPGMITLPTSILIGITTAYRRAGLAYERWQKHFGGDGQDVLVIRGPSQALNPTISQGEVDRAMADDPDAARADYFSEWRDDLSSYLSRDLVEAACDRGVTARPWRQGIRYASWFDSGGGRSDSFTCAVAHKEGDLAIVDATVEVRAPFDTSAAVAQVVALLRAYHLHRTMGDDYAAGFTVAEFRRHGITCEDRPTGVDRSVLYLEVQPAFVARRVRLLDDERAISQFAELEQRAMPGGHYKVNHPNRTGHHDDLANSIAGALWRATSMPAGIGKIPEAAMQWAKLGPYTARNRAWGAADRSWTRPRFGASPPLPAASLSLTTRRV